MKHTCDTNETYSLHAENIQLTQMTLMKHTGITQKIHVILIKHTHLTHMKHKGDTHTTYR